MLSFLLTLLVGITLAANGVADQIVYLDRPADSPNVEPWFNPANISAKVGEQIHFIARFTSSRVYDPAVTLVYTVFMTRVTRHLNGLLQSQRTKRRASTMEVV